MKTLHFIAALARQYAAQKKWKILFNISSIGKDAKFIIDSVFSGKISYIFIDYIKPGPDLAESIYRNTLNNAVDVIFLKNHGIVIGGKDIQEVQNKLEFILNESQSHGCIQKLPFFF